MQAAMHELYGNHISFEGVDFAGRLDPLIWADVARNHGIDASAEHDRFRAGYASHLHRLFEVEATSRLLPGVRELVEAIATHADLTLGLLTGNCPETGRLKISKAGLDPDVFPIAAWGDDAPQRADLPPVAMRRYAEHKGCHIEGDQVLIIGDTIHDVQCAQAHGCRSLAVATGPGYSIQQLHDTVADLVVEDLSDTKRILTWVLNEALPISE